MLSDTLKKVDDAEAKAQALIGEAQLQASRITQEAQEKAGQIEKEAAAKADREAAEAMTRAQGEGAAAKERFAAALSEELSAQKAKALAQKDAVVEEIISTLIA